MDENIKTTSFSKSKAKELLHAAKEKTKEGLDIARGFISDNKEFFVALGLLAGVRIINNASSRREKEKTYRVWDPQAGIYWTIRRPMTLEEKRYYTERVRAGVPRDIVLERLRLLK